MHWWFFSIIHYSLKSDNSLFINFFLLFIKNIGLFIIFRPPLFTIHYFFGSLFTIHYKIRPLFTNHYTPRKLCLWWLYPPQTKFVVVILFSRCPCVRASAHPSVTFCFLNILKSPCWIFIKPCKHVHICKTNTLDKTVRARGQFYYSYFPL